MRTARVSLAILAIFGLPLLNGCRSGALRKTIVFIPHNTAAAASVSEHAGAAAAARRSHVTLYWNGPSSDADVEQQIVLMDRAIRGDALGIVLDPVSTYASATAIYRATGRGIPVVVLGSRIPLTPSKNISFVLDNLPATGLLVATRVKVLVRGDSDIALLGVDPMYAGSVDRARAIEKAVKSIAPTIRTVAQPAGAFSFDEIELSAERMIQAHPQMRVIVGVNMLATAAAVAAIQATGTSGHIQVIGLDQGTDLLYLLRAGIIDSLVVQDRRAMGAAAVANILAARQDGRPPECISFPPLILTRANIDSPDSQNILRMDWREQP